MSSIKKFPSPPRKPTTYTRPGATVSASASAIGSQARSISGASSSLSGAPPLGSGETDEGYEMVRKSSQSQSQSPARSPLDSAPSSNLTWPEGSSSTRGRTTVHITQSGSVPAEEGEEDMDVDDGDDDAEANRGGRVLERGTMDEGEDSMIHEGQSEYMDDDVYSEWSDDTPVRPILHVDIRRIPRSSRNPNPQSQHMLHGLMMAYINSMEGSHPVGMKLDLEEWGHAIIMRNIDSVAFAELVPEAEMFDPREVEIQLHFYQLSTKTSLDQFTATTDDDDDESDAVPAATVRDLPSPELEGIWENTSELQPRILRYVTSTGLFSDSRIDFNKVSWNRLVLLHGPPGTGKTSLCRALAQKLMVRMGDTYTFGKLVEINSHSLFSKWFSESGKLVQKLFSHVAEAVSDPRCLVVVMIDEVESLTAARTSAASSSEPGDAIRVVNALLTQLDKLKTCPNVLVLTTSNIPDTIDSAFIDRADEKFFVDYPPPLAVYQILKGCLEELSGKGMMRPCTIPTGDSVKSASFQESASEIKWNVRTKVRGVDRQKEAGVKLWAISQLCSESQLAGRFLRRLPILAHSHYLAKTSRTDDDGNSKPRTIEAWLEAFWKVVVDETKSRVQIGQATNTTMRRVFEKGGEGATVVEENGQQPEEEAKNERKKKGKKEEEVVSVKANGEGHTAKPGRPSAEPK